jgi:uracil-DNA glycosylase
MHVRIEKTWNTALAAEFEKPYFVALAKKVHHAYETTTVFPPPKELFAAFDHCPLPNVKVVILGQDPYHGHGQANGLAFSVHDTIPIPPSLRNIYKEIQRDLGTQIPPSGDLTRWANQGVLLLNSSLSVALGEATSHSNWGWEHFTDAVINVISNKRKHVVFLLWGAFAISKRPLINEQKHLVLTAPHPSPLSAHRGFLGCKHFSKTNQYLNKTGQTPILW